ncbi:MAG: right-handed parallel beta-helix repeat-containing protein [Acidimicrobiia bacterium]|nr:right-handed parallel beta-helix repeat-containing protein [Acidimicrobiia bacterium]
MAPDDLPRPRLVPAVPAVGSLASDDRPNVLFVDPVTGDDAHDGQTSASAWRSLQVAVNRLTPGDTLYLMGGDYRGDRLTPTSSHVEVSVSGTAGAWIRIAAAPGQKPRIVATAGNGIEILGDYVAVEGLTVVGEGFGPDNDYGWGLMTRGNHHVRLAGNTIAGMAVGGITSIEATNLEITGNEVHDNSFWGSEQGSGISLWHSRDAGTDPGPDGYHDRIVGNLVYRNENKVRSMFRSNPIITDGNGIIVDQADQTGYTGRVLVADNVIINNGGRAVLVLESSRVDVVHNTTYHNARTAGLEGGPVELAAGRALDVRFVANLAWARPGSMALTVHNARAVVSDSNVFVTDRPVPRAAETDLVIADGVRLVTLPGEDPVVADFRPAPGSALVGRPVAALRLPALATDADGRARPDAGAAVGAYEPAPGEQPERRPPRQPLGPKRYGEGRPPAAVPGESGGEG